MRSILFRTRRIPPRAAALAVAASVALGALLAAPPKPAADAGKTLLDVDARFAREVYAKGFSAFDAFFAEDAVYLPTFEPRLVGKAAIMESFRPLFDDRTIRLNWTPLRADVAASGDLGWTTGSYELTRIDDQGTPHVRHGKYVTIWRKQPDGDWKAVLDGGNPDEPPPAPPATAQSQSR